MQKYFQGYIALSKKIRTAQLKNMLSSLMEGVELYPVADKQKQKYIKFCHDSKKQINAALINFSGAKIYKL